MSFLDPYVTLLESRISYSRLQASRFAKEVADDYNPIHDVEAKRFCVPGDLLFATLLVRRGLFPKMHFSFAGMVGDEVPLEIREETPGDLCMRDERGKEYLHAQFSGAPRQDPELIEQLVRGYVRFSGHNFPHILGPLMAESGMMINIERPLVIYESMTLDLQVPELRQPELELAGATLQVEGKRGNALLTFRFVEGGKTVGTGEKRMVLSGLKPYEAAGMEAMIEEYDRRKRDRVV